MAETYGKETDIGRAASPDEGGDEKSIDSDTMKLAG
jgi:choline transport protein